MACAGERTPGQGVPKTERWEAGQWAPSPLRLAAWLRPCCDLDFGRLWTMDKPISTPYLQNLSHSMFDPSFNNSLWTLRTMHQISSKMLFYFKVIFWPWLSLEVTFISFMIKALPCTIYDPRFITLLWVVDENIGNVHDLEFQGHLVTLTLG